jgi:hypothetical protein
MGSEINLKVYRIFDEYFGLDFFLYHLYSDNADGFCQVMEIY